MCDKSRNLEHNVSSLSCHMLVISWNATLIFGEKMKIQERRAIKINFRTKQDFPKLLATNV
jgi:hypothetical protein